MASGLVLTADVGILPAQNSLSCHSHHDTQEFFWVRKKRGCEVRSPGFPGEMAKTLVMGGRWVDAESRALPHFPALLECSQARRLQAPGALCPHLAQSPDLRSGAGRGLGASKRPSGLCKLDHNGLRDPAVPQSLKHRFSQSSLFSAAGMGCKPEQQEGQAAGWARSQSPTANLLCLSVTLGEPSNFSGAPFPKL